MQRLRHTLALVSLVGLTAPLCARGAGEAPRPEARPAAPPSHPWSLGASLPAFTGLRLDDPKRTPTALSSLRGQPLLVNLWASWCSACVAELPGLARLDARFAPRGLKTVGVSLDDSFDEAEMVAGDLDLKYMVLFDHQRTANDLWRAETIPATFLYDRAGRLVWRHSGLVRFEDPAFLAALEKALQGP